MFLSAGSSFLVHNRNVAMAALNPIMRYMYPFVQVSAAFLSFLSIIVITVYKRVFSGALLFMVSVLLTAIIYQRGMTISFTVLGLLISFDAYRLKRTLRFRVILGFLLVLLILFLVLVFFT